MANSQFRSAKVCVWIEMLSGMEMKFVTSDGAGEASGCLQGGNMQMAEGKRRIMAGGSL